MSSQEYSIRITLTRTLETLRTSTVLNVVCESSGRRARVSVKDCWFLLASVNCASGMIFSRAAAVDAPTRPVPPITTIFGLVFTPGSLVQRVTKEHLRTPATALSLWPFRRDEAGAVRDRSMLIYFVPSGGLDKRCAILCFDAQKIWRKRR